MLYYISTVFVLSLRLTILSLSFIFREITIAVGVPKPANFLKPTATRTPDDALHMQNCNMVFYSQLANFYAQSRLTRSQKVRTLHCSLPTHLARKSKCIKKKK